MEIERINYSVGDKVIALIGGKDPFQPRIKGKEYEVKAVSYCPSCGIQSINVSDTPIKLFSVSTCVCGKINQNNGKYWTYSAQFAKKELASGELIKKAKKAREYEEKFTI